MDNLRVESSLWRVIYNLEQIWIKSFQRLEPSPFRTFFRGDTIITDEWFRIKTRMWYRTPSRHSAELLRFLTFSKTIIFSSNFSCQNFSAWNKVENFLKFKNHNFLQHWNFFSLKFSSCLQKKVKIFEKSWKFFDPI